MMHALGTVSGWLVYACSPAYRRRMNTHLQRAGFHHEHHRAIAEAGKSLLELPFVWCGDPSRVLGSVTVHDWDVAQRAIDQGKGVVFLTPHLGCFEIIAQVIASRVPLTALYRPPRMRALQPLLSQARGRGDLRLAPATLSGVRVLLRTLREGGCIGLLPDQVPGAGEGVWADFFGQPAYTMTLPAKLVQSSSAPLVLSYAERLPHGAGYAVYFAPFERSLTGTSEQQARAINAAMESLIARCPSQYFWSYNRYKGRPPASEISA